MKDEEKKKKKQERSLEEWEKKKKQQNNQERCPSSYMYWGGHIKTRLTELDQNNGSGAHLYHVQIRFKMILKENAKGVWYNVQLRNGIKETLAKYENYKKNNYVSQDYEQYETWFHEQHEIWFLNPSNGSIQTSNSYFVTLNWKVQ